MNRSMASTANVPTMGAAVQRREEGKRGDSRAAKNANRDVKRSGAGVRSDLGEIMKAAVDNVMLFVVVAKQEGEVPTARIERPLMRENALQRVMEGTSVGPFGKQGKGFLTGQLHGRRQKRA